MPVVRIELPEEKHRRCKSIAALEGVTMREWLEDAIDTAIDAYIEEHAEPVPQRKRA